MERKLRILMIAETPRNLAEIKGGVEAATVNLLTGFQNLMVEFHVVSIGANFDEREIVKVNGGYIYYYPFTVKKSKFWEFLIFGNRKIKKLVQNIHPDIIHMQGTGPRLLMLRGLDKNKVVITQHGIVSEESKYKITLAQKAKFGIKAAYDNILLPRYHNLISISEYNKRIQETIFKKNPKFNSTIIYNPVNPEFFKAKRPEKLTRIIFIGLVNKLKGVHIMLDALHELKQVNINYTLDIVGGTKEPDYWEQMKNKIQAYELNEQVIMHGWVDQTRVKDIIGESSIFLLPSFQECLPISIAEAMAAGRVVVATNTGGIPEMIIHKKSGFLFEKGNVRELVEILKDIYMNKAEIERVSENAQTEAIEKFEPKTVAHQTITYYQCLVSNNQQKG